LQEGQLAYQGNYRFYNAKEKQAVSFLARYTIKATSQRGDAQRVKYKEDILVPKNHSCHKK